MWSEPHHKIISNMHACMHAFAPPNELLRYNKSSKIWGWRICREEKIRKTKRLHNQSSKLLTKTNLKPLATSIKYHTIDIRTHCNFFYARYYEFLSCLQLWDFELKWLCAYAYLLITEKPIWNLSSECVLLDTLISSIFNFHLKIWFASSTRICCITKMWSFFPLLLYRRMKNSEIRFFLDVRYVHTPNKT